MTKDQEPNKPKLLLVDFENVQQVELNRLDDSFRVIIFVGASQKNVPIELVTNAQKLGGRAEWQKVTGDGRNALDFFIAYQLGRVFEKSPRPDCVVLSRDKGFDPLLKYLNASGLKARRIVSLQELDPEPTEGPNVQRVVHLLGKLEKRSRPRKRKTLAQSMLAMFQKKLLRQDVAHIIDTMLAKRLISERNGLISYDF